MCVSALSVCQTEDGIIDGCEPPGGRWNREQFSPDPADCFKSQVGDLLRNNTSSPLNFKLETGLSLRFHDRMT